MINLPRRYFNISKFIITDDTDLPYARGAYTEPTLNIREIYINPSVNRDKESNIIPERRKYSNEPRTNYLKNNNALSKIDSYISREAFYKYDENLKKCLDFNLVPKYLTGDEQLQKVYETIEQLNKKNEEKNEQVRQITIENTFRTILNR